MLGDVEPNFRDARDFNWVEVKTGSSMLSSHQEAVRARCKIPVLVFRIRDVLAPVYEIWIRWESG